MMSNEFITLLCVNRQTDNIFYALVNKVIAYTHIGKQPQAHTIASSVLKDRETTLIATAKDRKKIQSKNNGNNGKILPKFGL